MAQVSSPVPRRCLLVLGMHRSGTSAITGSLARAGIPLGADLLAPGEDNPKGYFEHAEAVRIDDALLDALDRRWDDIRAMPPGWMKSDSAKDSGDAIRELLMGEFSAEPLFALKDPRMCRVAPLWIDGLTKLGIMPKVLLVVRDPREVAASIERRNGWPRAVSYTLWLDYMLEAEQHSRTVDRAVITYERFLENPSTVLAEALSKLGLDAASESMRSTDLSGFVSTDDRHHQGGEWSESPVGELARDAFALFASAAAGQDLDWRRCDAIGTKLNAELKPAADFIDGLAQMALVFRRDTEAAQTSLAKTQSELNAQLDWAQQATQKHESLLADLAKTRSDFLAQKTWSENAVREREALLAELAKVRSDFLGQEAWSENAVKELEALHVELAKVRSDFLAQQAWSENAVKEHEALHAELAKARSDFLAQQTWSENAVREREALQAELAGIRSELLAQDAWAADAVKEREALQAELAGVRSDLLAQQSWAENAVREREALQAELAGVRSDLLAQQAWAEDAVKERESLQAELAGVRSDLLGQVAWAKSAVNEREALESQLACVRSELSDQIELAEEAMRFRSELQGENAGLRQSLKDAELRVDHLQSRLNSIEATWLGRLNQRFLEHKSRPAAVKEDK